MPDHCLQQPMCTTQIISPVFHNVVLVSEAEVWKC